MRDNHGPPAGENGDIRYEIARLLSVLVALVGLVFAYWSPKVGVFHFTLAFVVLPLGCIWYGKEIGGFTADAQDDTHNPVGSLITYLGWIILFGMVAVLVWMQV